MDDRDGGRSRGGYSGGGYRPRDNDRDRDRDRDRSPKRKRDDERRSSYDDRGGRRDAEKLSEQAILGLLITCGDKSVVDPDVASLNTEIRAVCQVLLKDIEVNSDEIITAMLKCASCLPAKSCILGCICGLLNTSYPSFGDRLTVQLLQVLVDDLESQFTITTKCYMKFLCELVNSNVLSHTVLSTLLTLISPDNTEGDQADCDFQLYLILSLLPHCGYKLSKIAPEVLKRIIESVESVAAARKVPEGSTDTIFPPFENQPVDWIDEAWKAIQDLQEDEWICEVIQRPWMRLCRDSTPHMLESVRLQNTPKYPTVRVSPLRWLKAGDSSPDRFIYHDIVADTLECFEGDSPQCGVHLANCIRSPKGELYVVEALFGILLQLDQHATTKRGKFIQITTIFISLAKSAPDLIPPAIAHVIDVVFNRLDEIDAACRDCFVEWFAFYLNNTDFVWTWNEWCDLGEVSVAQQLKEGFISDILLGCCRLGHVGRLQAALERQEGGELSKYLPSDSNPIWPYHPDGSADIDERAIAGELLQLLNPETKQSPQLIAEWIQNQIKNGRISGGRSGASLIITTMLHSVSQSLFAKITLFSRFHHLLTALFSHGTGPLHILFAIEDYCNASAVTTMYALVDKALCFQLVDPHTVIQWVFRSPFLLSLLHRSLPWEFCALAASKIGVRIGIIRGDLDRARQAGDEDKCKRIEEALDRERESLVELMAMYSQEVVLALEDKEKEKERLEEKTEERGQEKQLVQSAAIDAAAYSIVGHLIALLRKYKDEIKGFPQINAAISKFPAVVGMNLQFLK